MGRTPYLRCLRFQRCDYNAIQVCHLEAMEGWTFSFGFDFIVDFGVHEFCVMPK